MFEHSFQPSKKNGVKRLKCGSLPAKADTVTQRTFYENTLYPLMQKAKTEKISLLFVDASHFVMGCDYLGYIYGKVRRFVRTYSGRSRYNVLGALDYVTKKLTTVTNDTYITATEVCALIKKVSIEYAGKPIYLVLDIDSITDSTDKSDKAIVDRLISENVQLFDAMIFDNIVGLPTITKATSKCKKVA